MDSRLEKLEARAYDTKPIWERALAELIDLGKRMDNLDRALQRTQRRCRSNAR